MLVYSDSRVLEHFLVCTQCGPSEVLQRSEPCLCSVPCVCVLMSREQIMHVHVSSVGPGFDSTSPERRMRSADPAPGLEGRTPEKTGFGLPLSREQGKMKMV